MTPNQVTATRVGAAFAAVALFTFFGDALVADLAAVLLTVAAIALDGVDGYIARTRGMATPLGAQLDILGDRVVENLFFTFLCAAR
jgi:CDP-diacylglycerol--glycerol-3-phosphate 3-phosphatidyltransferase